MKLTMQRIATLLDWWLLILGGAGFIAMMEAQSRLVMAVMNQMVFVTARLSDSCRQFSIGIGMKSQFFSLSSFRPVLHPWLHRFVCDG